MDIRATRASSMNLLSGSQMKSSYAHPAVRRDTFMTASYNDHGP